MYQAPPAATVVLCLDELGPVGTKTYPTHRWAWAGQRPTIAPDYGRRNKTGTFGAFEPHTGQAFTQSYDQRTSANFVLFLEAAVTHWHAEHLVFILDNLSIHKTLEVRLWAVALPLMR